MKKSLFNFPQYGLFPVRRIVRNSEDQILSPDFANGAVDFRHFLRPVVLKILREFSETFSCIFKIEQRFLVVLCPNDQELVC